jgi:glucose dehydrogenase
MAAWPRVNYLDLDLLIGQMEKMTIVSSMSPLAICLSQIPMTANEEQCLAYDKATGEQVGEVWMPSRQSGSPMTYSINGRQYIIVAISGGSYPGEIRAYALPDD